MHAIEIEGEEFTARNDSVRSLEDEQLNNNIDIHKFQSSEADQLALTNNLPSQNNPVSKDNAQMIFNNKIINQQSFSYCSEQKFLNSNSNDDSKPQQNQQYLWQLIPKQVTKPEGVFYLKGNIGIDLNPYDVSRVSFLNYYQQINTLTLAKNQTTLQMQFSADPKIYDPFQAAIQYLKYFPNRDCNELAVKLEVQEESQNLEMKVKSKMKEITELNSHMLKQANAKRREFEKFKKKKIASLSKDRYYGFIEFSFDYEDMSYKIVGGGFNLLLARLLGGCDLISLQEIFLRSGMLEFLEPETKWKLLNETINNWRTYFNKETRYEFNAKLLTLDDLVIQTDCVAQFFSSKENEIYKGYFHQQYEDLIFEKGLIIIENVISDFHVKQVNAIRSKYIKELNKNEFEKNQYQFLIPPVFRDDSTEGNVQKQEQNLENLINNKNTQQGYQESRNRSGSLNPLESKNAQTFETFQSSIQINSNSSIANNNNQQYKDQYDRQNNSDNHSEPAGLAQQNFSEKIKNLMTDIPHAVHASCFLEAFYANNGHQKTAQQDMFPDRTCGYKHILS